VYVCICQGISERRLRELVSSGVSSFEELQARTGVSTCCGSCEPAARAFIEEHVDSKAPELHTA
jgi:bacterioferritin-associated ferredoxin